jgi:DNA repair protein RecN (Recombination protein N)
VLLEVHLSNLGLIDDAAVELSPGLNVVTGETGVGKTLLVTSVALLTGARGNARLVRSGAAEAVVQGVFAPDGSLVDVLAAAGIDARDELVLVRRLGRDGRSRAVVGGQLSPVSALQEIGSRLIEIHGQGAGSALGDPSTQLAALDAFAGTADELRAYREALGRLRTLERERDALKGDERTRDREIELLSYQVDEITRAELAPDEEDDLATALARLEHGERLAAIGAEVVALIDADGAGGQLATAFRSLQGAASLDPSAAMLVERLGSATIELAELAREIRAWTDGLESDPARLERLRERRALIGSLKRKYGATVDEIIAFGAEASRRLDEIGSSAERLATIGADVERSRNDVDALAGSLSERRTEAAKRLTELVSAELPALALPNAIFRVACEARELSETGRDRVSFLFSSSRSKAPEPIGKIASGGELSRAMIAVTLALASSHRIPVLVFDEADQGVGGEAALHLARRLARLARSHQVLVVSHLPQIAAFADRHILVRRSGDEIAVAALEGRDRLAEISRMLAGLGSSDLAKAHAAELIDMAARERDEALRRAG